jgi:polyhydroxybutyrate depolymerase
MHAVCLTFALLLPAQADALKPGTHRRSLEFEKQTRTYLLHVPANYDAKKPTPLVVAYHGFSMTADMMPLFTGLTKKANDAGFLVAYPNGTGYLQAWNAGGFPGKLAKTVDDVAFTTKVLDEIATVVNVDAKRVYATGMSNGAMMCYRLAAELSDRFAAIAPVAGTMAIEKAEPKRPVPVLHFHGAADGLVPLNGVALKNSSAVKILSLDDTINAWVKIDHCQPDPITAYVPAKTGKLQISQKYYPPGADGAEVVLYLLQGGGHVWPGGPLNPPFLGATTNDINATDLMWEFFQRHRLP